MKKRKQKSKKNNSVRKNHWLLIVLISTIIGIIVGFIFYHQIYSTKILGVKTNKNNTVPKINPPHPVPSITVKIPILIYHYVEYVKDPGDKIRQSLNIIPPIFEKQLKTLKDAGYTFVTPSEIPAILRQEKPLPKNPVILTFDDGYRDFYTDVFPLLQKYQIKAVEYIVPNFLDKPNNLKSSQLKEIAESGLIEIGAHTMDHVYLKGIEKERAQFEILKSKEVLEGMLGKPVVSFAYPYGAFDLQAAKLVKEAGFTNAVSTNSGTSIDENNIYIIFRIRPGMRTGKELLDYLQAFEKG